MDVTVNQTAEGEKFSFLPVSEIKKDFLKSFVFDSKEQLIETKTEEFSAVCPFSGLPDIAKLSIIYKPEGGKCIELKSLKYYLTSFRNVGIYQELATKVIYEDLKEILETENISVETIYNVRGGFLTTCTEGKIK